MKKIIALVLALVMVLSLSTVAFAGEEEHYSLFGDVVEFLGNMLIKIKKDVVDDANDWNDKVDAKGDKVQATILNTLVKVENTLTKVGVGIYGYLEKSLDGVECQERVLKAVKDAGQVIVNNYDMVREVVMPVLGNIAEAIHYVFALDLNIARV